MATKERTILGALGYALAATPIATFLGLIVITLIAALDDAVTKVQLAGYWWVLLIVVFVVAFIYFLYEPQFRRNREREKAVNGLILYLKEQLTRQNRKQLSDSEVEEVRKMLMERVMVWAWFDSELWVKHFPNEKYSSYLFGIVDNFLSERDTVPGDNRPPSSGDI